MQHDLILARYGEIGLKSPRIRSRFEAILQGNIERAFEAQGQDCVVQRLRGRFLVNTSDIGQGIQILGRIFGLTSVSPAHVVSSRLNELTASAVEYFRDLPGRAGARTFAVRARRAGSHPFNSQDVARETGAALLAQFPELRVDLSKPDVELSVEVRDDKAYLFSDKVRAPGGLPIGSQGRVAVLLKDLNSLVAAWLMLKRGCTIVPVHFEGPTGNRERAEFYAEVLRSWHFRGPVVHVPHQETNEFPKDASCALCMRQMVRKATLVARRKKCKALVTGEAFSSTTVDNLTLFGVVTDLPILRPILGTTPEMVSGFLETIGLEARRSLPFSEPCPLRTHGRVADERARALELELGLEPRAHASVREREREPEVRPA